MRGTYLGTADVWGERVKVYATMRGDFRDTLNDPERIVETVEHEHVRYGDVPHVSITWTYGTERELKRGDGAGGAGIAPEVIDALGSDRARRIVELADRWHLNTMRAGCAHQAVVWEDSPYGRRPSLELTEPCPVTGYRYGHAWLVEIPPTDVRAELRSLFGWTAA